MNYKTLTVIVTILGASTQAVWAADLYAKDAATLNTALSKVKAGDKVHLAEGATISGQFTIRASGSSGNEITFVSDGTKSATIASSSGTAFYGQGVSYLKFINVNFAYSGPVITASTNLVAAVRFDDAANITIDGSTVSSNSHGVYFRNNTNGSSKAFNILLNHMRILGDSRAVSGDMSKAFSSQGCGVRFLNVGSGGNYGVNGSIQILNTEVAGFGFFNPGSSCGKGISFEGTSGDNGGTPGYGFQNIKIDNVNVHNNEMGGIRIWSAPNPSLANDGKSGDQRANRNITITDSWFHDNPGRAVTFGGSGIEIAAATGVTLTNNRTYANGTRNTNRAGPCGVLISNAKGVTVSRSSSYLNKTKGPYDGCGFDFDWGTTDSSMSKNSSWDNSGVGFFACNLAPGKAGNSRPVDNLTFTGNHSQRDGNGTGQMPFSIHPDGARVADLDIQMGSCNDSSHTCADWNQDNVWQNDMDDNNVGATLSATPPTMTARASGTGGSSAPLMAADSPAPTQLITAVTIYDGKTTKTITAGSTVTISSTVRSKLDINVKAANAATVDVALGNPAKTMRADHPPEFDFIGSDFPNKATYDVSFVPHDAAGKAQKTFAFKLVIGN